MKNRLLYSVLLPDSCNRIAKTTKAIFGLIMGVTLLLTATTATAIPVQSSGNGHYYEFIPNYGISWDAAKTAAEASSHLGMQGHLATVTSQAEDDFLFNAFGTQIEGARLASTPPNGDGAAQAWLGGNSPTRSTNPVAGWTWSTGEAWSYAGWRTGEPNGGFTQTEASAVEFQVGPTNGCVAQCWNDSPVNWHGIEGYIVEYDVPSAGPIVSFDANTLALTNGAVVPSWGGQTAVGTPTYLAAQTPNGSPAVEFNGSDRMGDNIALPAAGGDWILVAVIKPNSIGAYHNLADDDPSSRPMLWIDSAFNYELNFSGGGGAKAAGTGTGGWDIVIADSSYNHLYVNSTIPNASGGGGVSYPTTKLFDFFHRDGGQTYQGQVAEFRIYNNRADFGGDFAALYNEMHAKWIAANNLPPVANAGSAQSVECTGASSANVTLNGAASSDPDGDSLTYAWTWAGGSASGVSPATSFPLGTTTVTLTVDDQNGHTDTTTTTVTVQDTSAPTVNAGADVTIEATSPAGAAYDVAAQVTASDTCCNVSTSISPVGTYPLGANTVTVTATDCSSNSTSDQMIVNVVDTTDPALTLPADVLNFEATGVLTPVAIGAATATDIFNPVTVTSNAPLSYPLGTTVVTWTATDANGNVSTGTQNVNVVDTTAPVVTATLVPYSHGDEDDDDSGHDSDEGRFLVQFTVSDIVDANPTVSAVLNINGHATPVTVTNGQIIEFEYEDEKTEVEVEDGMLEIEAPAMTFNVTATDASGNTGTASAQPQGLSRDNDDEDDDDDD